MKHTRDGPVCRLHSIFVTISEHSILAPLNRNLSSIANFPEARFLDSRDLEALRFTGRNSDAPSG